MDGQSGPLRSWEKIYWWIFVAAIAFFLYSRLSGKDTVEVADPEVSYSFKQQSTFCRLQQLQHSVLPCRADTFTCKFHDAVR